MIRPLQDIVTFIRTQTQESGTKRFSDSNIIGIYNDGIGIVGARLRVDMPGLMTVSALESLASGVNTHYLPCHVDDFNFVEVLDSQSVYKPMVKVPEEVAYKWEDSSDTFDRDGTNHYVIRGHSIEILESTVPTLSNGLRWNYLKKPAPLHTGFVAAGGASTVTLDTTPNNGKFLIQAHAYLNEGIWIVSGTAINQYRKFSSYAMATSIATVNEAWTTQPVANDVYSLISILPSDLTPLLMQYVIDVMDGRRTALHDLLFEYDALLPGLGPRGPQPTRVQPWGM
jgi:hypothetical protein